MHWAYTAQMIHGPHYGPDYWPRYELHYDPLYMRATVYIHMEIKALPLAPAAGVMNRPLCCGGSDVLESSTLLDWTMLVVPLPNYAADRRRRSCTSLNRVETRRRLRLLQPSWTTIGVTVIRNSTFL